MKEGAGSDENVLHPVVLLDRRHATIDVSDGMICVHCCARWYVHECAVLPVTDESDPVRRNTSSPGRAMVVGQHRAICVDNCQCRGGDSCRLTV